MEFRHPQFWDVCEIFQFSFLLENTRHREEARAFSSAAGSVSPLTAELSDEYERSTSDLFFRVCQNETESDSTKTSCQT